MLGQKLVLPVAVFFIKQRRMDKVFGGITLVLFLVLPQHDKSTSNGCCLGVPAVLPNVDNWG